MICSNCYHEEIDHEGKGQGVKCYGNEDWLCSCRKFENK